MSELSNSVNLKRISSIVQKRKIEFHTWDYISLFLIKMFPCLIRSKSKSLKLKRLYDTGYEKIKEGLDILRIMKDLADIKIVLENSIMTDRVKNALIY